MGDRNGRNHLQDFRQMETASTSTLQRLKERARSVDRYLTQPRLTSHKTAQRGITTAAPRDSSIPPAREDRQTVRKSRPSEKPLTSDPNGHIRQSSQRWRSPSLNGRRIQQNLQNLVGYLFERKNDAKKRALAEKLLWTALRRNESSLIKDILDQLQDPPLDINGKNEFGWNLVDEAVMLGHEEIAAELFRRGAKESPELRIKSQRQEVLRTAIRGLETLQAISRQQTNASTKVLAADVAYGPMFNIVQQMIQNVEKIRPPRNYLTDVTVEAWSDSAVAVHQETRPTSPGIISRFKVEWCQDRNFETSVDFEIFQDLMNPPRLIVEGLIKGVPYFFRMSVANLAGFGMPLLAQPAPLILTSWKDLKSANPVDSANDSRDDLMEILQAVENLEHVVRNTSDRRRSSVRVVQRRPSLKDSIKSMIKTAQARSMSLDDGGLFLGSLIAADDSVILTTDNALPVCLVQSPFLGTVSARQHLWLQKLASVATLAAPIKELLYSSKDSTSDIRFSMVQSLLSLQAFLGLEDLGMPYFRAIHDERSSLTLLLLIKRIDKSDFYRPPFGLKWIHVKEAELLSIGPGPRDDMLTLLKSVGISELLAYDRCAQTAIPAGLHLGFIQLQPSLDNVAVVLAKNHPSTLPSTNIQENSHVSRSQWEMLLGNPSNALSPYKNPAQRLFRDEITAGWLKLKHRIALKSVEDPFVYESILQLGPQTTMMILYTDARDIAAKRTLDEELRRDALSMAVQTFESLYFGTYDTELWSLYCQSSLLLDALNLHLNQCQREVFQDDQNVKHLLGQVQLLQDRLERTWNCRRWLPDVIKTVTGRGNKRIPLITRSAPRLPTRSSKRTPPPKLPPRSINTAERNHQKSEIPNAVSITIAIYPNANHSHCKSPNVPCNPPTHPLPEEDHYTDTLDVKIDSSTTAQDVILQVLRHTVGHLAEKLLPFYRLRLVSHKHQIDLVANDLVAFHRARPLNCGAQFLLVPQEEKILILNGQ